MKIKNVIIIIFLINFIPVFAQKDALSHLKDTLRITTETRAQDIQDVSIANVQNNDTLHLPMLNNLGQVPTYNYISMYPLHWSSFSSWYIHEGLNVNIGASVFAEFGKHARHGAGFGQNIALQYATPLTDKLSLSIGGFINNIYWQRDTYRNAGFSAVLGYKFNEKWEAYVYGQKSIIQNNNFLSRPMYYWDEVGDKIGAAVKYNFSEAFSVQLSVEEHVYPQNHMPRHNPQFGNTALPSEQYFNR